MRPSFHVRKSARCVAMAERRQARLVRRFREAEAAALVALADRDYPEGARQMARAVLLVTQIAMQSVELATERRWLEINRREEDRQREREV